jgi:hypothetical protein
VPAAQHWQPILATLEDELKAKGKPPANRQQRRAKGRK